MLDLERYHGPFRLRTWGLILNFLCNALALYGLTRVLAGEGGEAVLTVGGIGTLTCIAVLARPSR